MRGTIFSRLRAGASNLFRDQRGNAMMLTAAAIVPVIGIVGSAVDIGRAYMTQLRLQQACDAGVLAGRRAMAGGTYGEGADTEAHKMFNFNFPAGIYGSTSVDFSANALEDTSDVGGTATTQLPTALMYIFGVPHFDLSVDCAAKLEISNTDMMLVLDVTGSMDGNTSDGKKRITALKDAAKLFFKTITSADAVGDGRLRFGVVPYSSSVNVGDILATKNSAWLSDYTLLPSRSAITKLTWSGGTPAAISGGAASNGAWTDIMPISGFTTSSACSGLTPPSDTTPTTTAVPNANATARWVDSADKRVYSNDKSKVHYYYNYRYTLSGGMCWLQRRLVTYTQTTAATTTPSTAFRNQYRYEDRLFDVSAVKTGSNLVVDTGDGGATRTFTWGGCIMERRTSPFGSSSSAPSDALDMDVDAVPTDAEETKWRLLLPEVAFARAQSVSSTPSYSVDTSKRKVGIVAVDNKALTVDSGYVTADSKTGGDWQSYAANSASGWGVCPAKAHNLTKMTASDESTFNTWIDALQPLGGTYHDIGMLWGIRLMSPIGLFSAENDENAPDTNKRPIQRHIIFMTDGEMAPNMPNLSAQGYEFLMQRVSGSASMSDTDLTARHNNRFGQLCEIAKDEKHNVTIWVIGFGVNLNDQLLACASPGNGVNGRKAYQTSSSTELQGIFQSIANQISRLRLSQ